MQRTTKLVTALGALAIVVGACGGGATEAPSTAPSEGPSTAPSEAPSEAPALSGDLTVWNAYGSGGTAEGKAFEHHWQDFRTRKDRSLKTRTDIGWELKDKGPHRVCVKVIDVFGVDTTTVIEAEG